MLQKSRRKARTMSIEVLRDHVARYKPPTERHREWFAYLPEADREAILKVQDVLEKVDLSKPKVIVLGCLKGGVGKTTTTVYESVFFSFVVPSVLAVDGDGENKQTAAWSTIGTDWPANLRFVPWAGMDPIKGVKITPEMMRKNIAFQVEQAKFQLIFVDTGPQDREQLEAALAVADDFIITTSHRPLDKSKVLPSVALAAEMERKHGRAIAPTVLICDTKKNVLEFRELITLLDENQVPRFDTVIGSKESFSNAPKIGMPQRFEEYGLVALELAQMWADAEQEAAEEELAGEQA